MSATPIKFFDRVSDVTATTGTGDLTLVGSAPTGFRTFGSVLANGDYCYYVIDDGAGNWESGIGKYVSSGTKLQRSTVLESSNSNAAVNFGAGTKSVFIDVGAKAIKHHACRSCHYTPFVIGADDDEFDDDNFSGWTLVDDGTHQATITEQNDCCSISLPGGDTTAHIHAWMKATTISANDYVEACIRGCGGKAQNFNLAGVIMADGTTYNSGIQILACVSQNESNGMSLVATTGYNAQTGSTAINVSYSAGLIKDNYFLRLMWGGGSAWSLYVSPDGITWTLAGTLTLSMTPTKLGFWASTWGGSSPASWSIRYVRHAS